MVCCGQMAIGVSAQVKALRLQNAQNGMPDVDLLKQSKNILHAEIEIEKKRLRLGNI